MSAILPRPTALTPAHRLTWCALNQAQRLADLLVPATEAQAEAQQRIAAAARSGNLYAAVQAVQAACTVGRRGLATLDWREWAENWLARVERLILGEIEQGRMKAA